MSILSKDMDGCKFFYGFAPGDHRQINVRKEADGWIAYVHGDRIGAYEHKDDAEAAAVKWIETNPSPDLPDLG